MKKSNFTKIFITFLLTLTSLSTSPPLCELNDDLYYKRITVPSIPFFNTLKIIESAPKDTEVFFDICTIHTNKIISFCPELDTKKKYFYVTKKNGKCKGVEFKSVRDIIYKGNTITFNFEFEKIDTSLSIFPKRKPDEKNPDSYTLNSEEKGLTIKIFKPEKLDSDLIIEEGYFWDRKDNYIWLFAGILKIVFYGALMMPFKFGEPVSYKGRFKPLDFMINYLFLFYLIDAAYQFSGIFHPVFCSIVIILASAAYGLFASYSIWATKKFYVCKLFLNFLIDFWIFIVLIENTIFFTYLGFVQGIIFVVYLLIAFPICFAHNKKHNPGKNFEVVISFILCFQFIQIACFTFVRKISIYGAFKLIQNPNRITLVNHLNLQFLKEYGENK